MVRFAQSPISSRRKYEIDSTLLAGMTLAAALLAQPPGFNPPKTTLKVGDMAPDFTLPDTDNKPVKLSDFRGKKTVVLAFFVAAFTGG